MTDTHPTDSPTRLGLTPELLSWRTGLIVCVAFSGSLLASLSLDGGRPHIVTGTLRAPETRVVAPGAVTLREHLVQELDLIRQGQDVARVEDESLLESIRSQQLQCDALRGELDQVRAQADLELTWRIKDLEAEILQQQLLSADLLKRQFNSQLMFHAWKKVSQSGQSQFHHAAGQVLVPILFEVSSPSPFQALLEHQTARNTADVCAVQIAICDQRIERLKRLRGDLPDKVRSAAEIERVQIRLRQAEIQLEQLQACHVNSAVVSDGFGTVIQRHGLPGVRLQAGDPIVTLLDRHRRYVAVDVPSEFVGRFVENRSVVLSFAEDLQRMGRVRQIPLHTSPGQSTVQVQIEPTGLLWPQVPIGSEIQVRIPPAVDQREH
ncbi:MAG: hypothetical protein ABGZ17_17320 [Planctomycetaceae bacterium]